MSAAPKGDAVAKVSRLDGVWLPAEAAVGAGVATAVGVAAGAAMRSRKWSSPSAVTASIRSALPQRIRPCPGTPRRADESAANNPPPFLGRRRPKPTTSRHGPLAERISPSAAQIAAGSVREAAKAAKSVSPMTDAVREAPRKAIRPKNATPASPARSSRPAIVDGPALNAGMAARTTASTKKQAPIVMIGSNRRFASFSRGSAIVQPRSSPVVLRSTLTESLANHSA